MMDDTDDDFMEPEGTFEHGIDEGSDQRCSDCGCDLFTEAHAIDCGYDDESEDEA